MDQGWGLMPSSRTAYARPMSKQHYLFRLIPPRPTFAQDMTAQEGVLMQAHARYLHEQFTAGHVLLYGPVMAADGAFGLAVLEMDDEGEAQRFGERDPTVEAGLNRFELSPMHVAAARALGV
jgi:uncharacterized protein YciI